MLLHVATHTHKFRHIPVTISLQMHQKDTT